MKSEIWYMPNILIGELVMETFCDCDDSVMIHFYIDG